VIWGYIVLAYLSLFALGISDNIRGPLFPEILKAFEVSDTAGAVYYAISSFCGFLSSLMVRTLLLRWSRVRSLQFSLVLMTIGLIGMGAVKDFAWLLFSAAIFGASLGIMGVMQNVMVSLGSLPHRRQKMLAGLHSNYGLASVLAPLTVAFFSEVLGSWRYVFYVVSLAPFSVFVGSFFWREKPVSTDTGSVSKVIPPTPQSRKDHFGQMFVAGILAFYVLAEIMVSSRLSLFARRELGLDLQQSSYYLMGFFVFLLAGRLLFTFVDFKWPLRGMLGFSLLSSMLLCAVGLQGYPILLSLSGFFMAPFYPLAIMYVASHYEKNMDSAMSYTVAIQSVFTVCMHGLVGYLTDRLGISSALWVGPMALGLSFIMLMVFERVFRRTA